MRETQFPILTICGSMRYYQDMIKAAEVYTAKGWIVLMPFVTYNNGVKVPGDKFADMLAEMHTTKMSMSDAILVIGSHRGESTTAEITWALANKIQVIELESVEPEVPRCYGKLPPHKAGSRIDCVGCISWIQIMYIQRGEKATAVDRELKCKDCGEAGHNRVHYDKT